MKRKSALRVFSLLIIIIMMMFNVKTATLKASTYVDSDAEFRAIWVTPITGDIGTYSTEAAFKNEMNTVFNVMEKYKLNALVFHIRTHNNALYDSTLNPKASYWKNVNFTTFDPLEWLITESHKRGIEFHAWMNPYRVNSNYYGSTLPSSNPASNASNLLSYNGNSILNPGLPVVREFLINSVMEVIQNYDVDAIHFDDYFYINLGANGALTGINTILNEPDQSTFIAYPNGYNTNSASDKADWRRDQVNTLVQGVHNAISNYNTLNAKNVQFGISPTGIYKNGNGVVTYDENGKPVTTGSLTTGQTHYSSYLFCDSLKWATEGWIDYILPQSYWATNHPAASYYNVMSWWDKVVKNLNVNLYSGIGIYMADNTNTYNWNTDLSELQNQLTYINTLENVKGASFYSYKFLKSAYNGATTTSAKQLANIGTNVWFNKVLLPEIKSMVPIYLNRVDNFNVSGNTVSFNKVNDAKFYAIYRSTNTLIYSPNELVTVIGANPNLSTVLWTDALTGDYKYGVKPISYTNTKGEASGDILINLLLDTGVTKGTEVTNNGGLINENTIGVGFTRHVYLGEGNIDESRLQYTWTSSDDTVATISIYGTITALKPGTTIIKGVYIPNTNYKGEIVINVYDNGNGISYVLNGGGFYKYTSKDEMVADFINDFNTVFNMNIIKERFQLDTYGKNVFNIFTNPTYGAKWMWMREYIIQVARDQNHASLSSLESNNDATWRSSIDSFINNKVRTAWPASADYTTVNAAYGFWNRLIVTPPTTYVYGTITPLPIPLKVSYTFDGWYDNSSFIGTPITSIDANAKGNKTYYAKWIIG